MIRKAILSFVAAVLFAPIPAGAVEPGRAAVLVMPIEFEVGQVTAGGVFEALADESELASLQLRTELGNWLSRHPQFDPVDYPVLDDADAGLVSEHLALFDVAIQQAFAMQDVRKGRPFDYTIGPGLAFLEARSGADKAILFAGASLKSTGGRTALKILELLMFGVMSPLSASVMYAGMVDLDTGRIEWVNRESVGTADVTTPAGARDVVDRLLGSYPHGPLSIHGAQR